MDNLDKTNLDCCLSKRVMMQEYNELAKQHSKKRGRACNQWEN